MSCPSDIEDLLGRTGVPRLVEGIERARVKERLLREVRATRRRREMWRIHMPLGAIKVAGACLLAALLIAAGWGTERILSGNRAGRLRLLRVERNELHLCEDLETGRMLHVQRLQLPDGRVLAAISTQHAPEGEPIYTTYWREHLGKLDEGSRKIVDRQVNNMYIYEAPLSDGSIATFGSSDLLKKLDG